MDQSISHQMQVLFATFPPAPGDLGAQMEAYATALEGHDERDISAAVRRFIRGEVAGHNQSFPPSASKLGATVRQCMNDRLDSEARDRARRPVLPPPDIVHTPEERERVAALAANLAASLRTEDAEAERRHRAGWSKTHAMFDPDASQEAVRRRLGFEAGDPDGERDIA